MNNVKLSNVLTGLFVGLALIAIAAVVAVGAKEIYDKGHQAGYSSGRKDGYKRGYDHGGNEEFKRNLECQQSGTCY